MGLFVLAIGARCAAPRREQRRRRQRRRRSRRGGDRRRGHTADDESDDPAYTTEPSEDVDDEDPSDKPDADGDGVPDIDDPDDDDDGIPDVEDPDDDGDDIPDEDEPGDGGDDDGEPGDDEDPVDEDPPAEVDLLRNDPRPAVDAWIDAAGDGAKGWRSSSTPTTASPTSVTRPTRTRSWIPRAGEKATLIARMTDRPLIGRPRQTAASTATRGLVTRTEAPRNMRSYSGDPGTRAVCHRFWNRSQIGIELIFTITRTATVMSSETEA